MMSHKSTIQLYYSDYYSTLQPDDVIASPSTESMCVSQYQSIRTMSQAKKEEAITWDPHYRGVREIEEIGNGHRRVYMHESWLIFLKQCAYEHTNENNKPTSTKKETFNVTIITDHLEVDMPTK